MYIVEFENGDEPWWLAEWTGDPGRTVVKGNAKIFDTMNAAKKALTYTIKNNPYRKLSGRGKVIKMTKVNS